MDVHAASLSQQTGEYFAMHAGQSVGLIHDLPGAGEVVREIVPRGAGGAGGAAVARADGVAAGPGGPPRRAAMSLS